MSKKFKLGSLGTRQFNRRVPNAKQEEEKKKVFTMVKVRKGKMWGKLRGTNSKSDEIPHPNCDIKAYGCSSPLTLFLNEAAKNGGKVNNFTGWKSGYELLPPKSKCLSEEEEEEEEEGDNDGNELKRSWFLFVVLGYALLLREFGSGRAFSA